MFSSGLACGWLVAGLWLACGWLVAGLQVVLALLRRSDGLVG